MMSVVTFLAGSIPATLLLSAAITIILLTGPLLLDEVFGWAKKTIREFSSKLQKLLKSTEP